MQSGKGKNKRWILKFQTKDNSVNPLMGWESTKDMLSEIKLQFSSQAEAVNYAKKNNISYYVIDPQKRRFVKKSYSDNFIKK